MGPGPPVHIRVGPSSSTAAAPADAHAVCALEMSFTVDGRRGEQEGPALAWQLDEEDWAMMVTSWRDDGGVDDQRMMFCSAVL